jgi:mutator protein MutT
MHRIEVAIAILFRDRRLLIARRPRGKHLAGLWEFPGGKRKPDESIEQCLIRELREEVGLTVRPSTSLPVIEYDYGDLRVALHPFFCTIDTGSAEPEAQDGQELRWIAVEALKDYPFPPANANLIEMLIEQIATAG